MRKLHKNASVYVVIAFAALTLLAVTGHAQEPTAAVSDEDVIRHMLAIPDGEELDATARGYLADPWTMEIMRGAYEMSTDLTAKLDAATPPKWLVLSTTDPAG